MDWFVSCIIPTYNRADILRDAIESIMAQTYPHWELVIVDDQSTDNTEAVVREYAERDNRIRYFRNPGKGQSAARNYALSLIRGDLIAFLDDDDISLPHRFEVQVAAMKKSGCDFLVSGYQVKNRNTGELIAEYRLPVLNFRKASFPSRWMLKTALAKKVGGFDEAYPCMTDAEFSYRVAEFATFTLQKEIVTIMYQTPGSASKVRTTRVDGRQLLIEKNKDRMDALEAGWWHFATGIDYYALGDKSKAGEQLRKAAQKDERGLYGLAYRYFQLTSFLGGPFKRVHLKVLLLLRDHKFSAAVDHPIVG